MILPPKAQPSPRAASRRRASPAATPHHDAGRDEARARDAARSPGRRRRQGHRDGVEAAPRGAWRRTRINDDEDADLHGARARTVAERLAKATRRHRHRIERALGTAPRSARFRSRSRVKRRSSSTRSPCRWRRCARCSAPRDHGKIVHDIAFDARILAENGTVLGNVFDTSPRARMLGRCRPPCVAAPVGARHVTGRQEACSTTTGPGAPSRRSSSVLADDVAHLPPRGEARGEVATRGIADELEGGDALSPRGPRPPVAAGDPRPFYARLEGYRPDAEGRSCRSCAASPTREAEAKALDVPPYKVIGPDVLFAIAARARARWPTSTRSRTRRASRVPSRRSSLAAVEAGIADGDVPQRIGPSSKAPAAPPTGVAKAACASIARTRHSDAEAERGVDEQVVLAGPAIAFQDLADPRRRRHARGRGPRCRTSESSRVERVGGARRRARPRRDEPPSWETPNERPPRRRGRRPRATARRPRHRQAPRRPRRRHGRRSARAKASSLSRTSATTAMASRRWRGGRTAWRSYAKLRRDRQAEAGRRPSPSTTGIQHAPAHAPGETGNARALA